MWISNFSSNITFVKKAVFSPLKERILHYSMELLRLSAVVKQFG
jgi:hypothetical protein